MRFSLSFCALALSSTLILLWDGSPCRAQAHEGGLNESASGASKVLTNSSGASARRRTRPAKPKRAQSRETAKTATDYFSQGDEYFEKEQYAEAVKAYEKALRLDPKYEEAYYALSDAYFKLGEDAKANDADSQGLALAREANKLVSGGVLNSKALSLPDPTTPPIAKSVRASGTVVVQVTINENGDVMTASAVSGHPLLRAAAVQAAMEARFSPLKVSGVPAKVTGIINYIFNVQ